MPELDKMSELKIDKELPSREGKDHINMYSKSNNDLGKWLSNMSHSVKIPTKYGIFDTLEGYWFYLKVKLSGVELKEEQLVALEKLKTDTGHNARINGTELVGKGKLDIDFDLFKKEFRIALSMKASINPDFIRKLAACKLPLVHYYYYGNEDNAKVMMHKETWISEHWDNLRNYYRTRKGDRTLTCIGTRNPAPQAAKWAENFGEDITRYGFTLRSGHAEGMDIAFEKGARRNKNPNLEIFVTGKKHDFDDLLIITKEEKEFCLRILHESKICHWQDKLDDYTLALYARNVQQVLGKDLSKASDGVVYFTQVDKNFRPTGGTRIAVQLAEYFGIRADNIKYAYTRLGVEDLHIRPAE